MQKPWIFTQIANACSGFLKNRIGSVAPLIALMSPALLGASGLAMDYAFMQMKYSHLQELADAAALSATNELSVSLQGSSYINSVVKNYVTSAVADTENIEITSAVEGNSDTVAVTLSLTWKPFFAQYFSSKVTPLVVSAKATLAARDKICVLGLMPDTLAGVHLDNKSKLTATNCGVYSNSTSVGSIRTDSKARGVASTFCASGGYQKLGNVSLTPKPQTDCPVVPDPLAARPKPTVGGCDYNKLVVKSRKTLKPGVYCGGLKIEGRGKAKLKPGVYIIKDGPLLVKGKGELKGKSVGFFLTGDDSIFKFDEDTKIDLKAPIDGIMAGLLFFEDQNVTYSFVFNQNKSSKAPLPPDVRQHQISSNNAKQLLGTIYLSRSILLVDADASVAQDSAYTAIVVGRLWLQQGPNLVLNANYSVTDVPVPAGLAGGFSRLIE